MPRLPVLVWSVALLCVPLTVTWAQRTTDVVISASGSVSGGSYQAGVNWVLVEFLRRLKADRAFQQRVFGDAPARDFRLTATAGASAGNINALIAALSYCSQAVKLPDGSTTSKIPPERSLFWNLWVNTGISEMLPSSSSALSAEGGVLDRAFFERVQLKVLEDFANKAVVPARGCRIPVGVTLTSVDTIPFTVASGVIAAVQRVATAFVVAAGDTSLRVDPLDDAIIKRRSFGAFILLPDIYRDSASTPASRLRSAFDAVVASSSLPVAFEPRTLRYRYPADETERQTAFVDGSLFDNNPLSLVFELHIGQRMVEGQTPRREDTVLVAYANPKHVSDAMRPRADGAAPQTREGLANVMQLLARAFTAARQYELHAFGRQLQHYAVLANDNPGLIGVPTLRAAPASRTVPIYGAHLGTFAAFLGRPFREYDFYAGIHDGLDLIARWFVCPNGPESGAELERCAQETQRRFVETNLMELTGVGRRIIDGLSAFRVHPVEQPPHLRQPVSDTASAALHDYLLEAVFDAAQTLRPSLLPPPCKSSDLLALLLCTDGIIVPLRQLAGDPNARRAANTLADRCHEMPDVLGSGACLADRDFAALVNSPSRYLNELGERALTRLHDVEERVAKEQRKASPFAGAAQLALMVFRSTNYAYRGGVSLNASSARWDARSTARLLESVAGFVIPNYITVGAAASAERSNLVGYGRVRTTSITAGWLPALYLPWGLQAVAPVELSRFIDVRDNREGQTSVAYGGGLKWHGRLPLKMSSLQVSVMQVRHIVHDEVQPTDRRFAAYEVAGRWGLDKLRLGVRHAPGRATAMTLGVSDLNGIAYWLIR